MPITIISNSGQYTGGSGGDTFNQGLWSADTNLPDLTLIDTTASENQGKYWTVATSGTTDITSLNLGSITEVSQGDELKILSNSWVKLEGGVTEDLIDSKIAAQYVGVTTGQVIKKGAGSTLVSSSLNDNGDDLISEKSIKIPPSSIIVGEDIILSDLGGSLAYISKSLEEKRALTFTAYDNTGTTKKPHSIEFEAKQVNQVLQTVDTDTLNIDDFTFNRTATVNENVTKIIVKIGNIAPSENVELNIFRNTDKLILKMIIDHNLISADALYEIVLSPSIVFYANEILTFNLKSAATFSIKGSTTLQQPYFAVDRQNFVLEQLATETWVNRVALNPTWVAADSNDSDITYGGFKSTGIIRRRVLSTGADSFYQSNASLPIPSDATWTDWTNRENLTYTGE